MTNHILEIFDIFRKISPLPDEIICKIIYTNNCIVHPIAKQLKKEYNCIKDAMFFKNANKSQVLTVVRPEAINCNSSVTAIPVLTLPKSNAKILPITDKNTFLS